MSEFDKSTPLGMHDELCDLAEKELPAFLPRLLDYVLPEVTSINRQVVISDDKNIVGFIPMVVTLKSNEKDFDGADYPKNQPLQTRAP